MAGLRSVFALVLVMSAFSGVGTAHAAEGYHARLDALARQSMRAYRMTKSVCLVMMGAQTQIHSDVAIRTSLEFEDQMTALISGNTETGLEAEENPELQALFKDILTYAIPMTISARQVASGDFHAVPVSLLLQRHQMVSSQIETIWRQAAATYSGQTVHEGGYLKTIEAAHRLNALSQEVLRDLCYIRLGLAKEETQHALAEKMERFGKLNKQLKDGDPAAGLITAPNIYIKIGYDKVASRWRTMKPILESAVAGEDIEIKDIQLASVMGESLIKQMNDILRRYEPPQ